MLNTLYVGPVSACFELRNENPYYAPQRYTVYLDEKEVSTGDANVFSVFDLKPDTFYSLRLTYEDGCTEAVTFTTATVKCGVNIRDFGAVGDGRADDTHAIQTALFFMPRGGLLYFPAGTYLTAPLALKSHITLQFAEGATLLGTTNRSRYPVLPGELPDKYTGEALHFGSWEGNAAPMYQALLTAEYAEDITIIGPGTVDGNAQNSDWWTTFQNDPVGRPRLMFFNRCKQVTIHGVKVQNSASWQLHPYYSEHIRIYDVFVGAPKDSPNTDAIDPESCDYVDIIGCRFSVGDDCIAVKSSKIDLGRKYKRAADHHTIRNCLMDYGHGAVTLGSEIGAGVLNLSVSQCWFRGTDRGLRIKTRRGRGRDCRINNVLFENIRMEGVLTPVTINEWYNCCDPDRFSEYVWSREMLPVDERTPILGKFTFRHLNCTDVQVAACYIDGLPEMPIEEVAFANCDFLFAEDAKPGVPIMKNFAKEECRLGLYLDNVKKIKIRNVRVEGALGDKLIADNYERLDAPDF